MAGSQDFIPDPRNANALVYLNGALIPRSEAKVSIFDGGFVVGDGVWEGLRLHQDALLFLSAHMDRLYWGAKRIALNIGLEPAALVDAMWSTLRANQMHDGVHIRVMVTRGEKTALNQDPRNAIGKATIAIVAEHKLPSTELQTAGLKLHTSSIKCTPADMFDMRLNSHSRLNLITALLEAADAGADEALMLDPQGYVSSCNATNFFMVRNGVVWTSSGDYCFHGVTRGNVIDLCTRNGIPIELGNFTMQQTYEAEEAFVTGTFGGITPVRIIDQCRLPSALPGPITQQMRSLYERLKNSQAAV